MKKLLLVGVALCSAGFANAATVVFNFDDLGDQVLVPANYGGASWSGFTTASVSFGPSSLPNLAYNSGGTGILDYAAGFTALSFTAGVFAPGTFSVYSGLGGTGTLLGSVTLFDPPHSPFAFAPASVAFAGTGYSVVVSGGIGEVGWDDVTLTTGGAVPEPATWAMLIAGFGLVGATARRRRVAAVAA